jgi:DNA-binding IclR family transcriptional regulator
MNTLPGKLARVGQLLLDGNSPTEIAQQLATSRSSAYRYLDQLRGIFHQAGLDRYIRVSEAA